MDNKCINCNTIVGSNAKFCTNCGKPLPKTKKCIQCGAFIKEEALFCTNCGTKQPVKEEKPKVEEVQQKNEVKTENPTPKKEEKTVVVETPKKEGKSIVSEPKVKQPTQKVYVKVKSSSEKKDKEPVISETKKKQDENDWDSILFFLKHKIKWSSILFIICFATITYLKMNKKSNKIEEYQQEYVSASSNVNAVLNDKEDDFEPITLEEFYNDYVFGNKDFSRIANKVCTPRLLQYLKDAYEYECENGECYAMWLFRSGNQDGTSDECRVVNVKDEGDGWVGVLFIDMGITDTVYIRFVSYNGQKLMDEIWKSK